MSILKGTLWHKNSGRLCLKKCKFPLQLNFMVRAVLSQLLLYNHLLQNENIWKKLYLHWRWLELRFQIANSWLENTKQRVCSATFIICNGQENMWTVGNEFLEKYTFNSAISCSRFAYCTMHEASFRLAISNWKRNTEHVWNMKTLDLDTSNNTLLNAQTCSFKDLSEDFKFWM